MWKPFHRIPWSMTTFQDQNKDRKLEVDAWRIKGHLLCLHSFYLEEDYYGCAEQILTISQILNSAAEKNRHIELDALIRTMLRESEMNYYMRTLNLIADFPRFVESHASGRD